MKVAGYICCMLSLVSVISTTDTLGVQNKMDRQFFNSLPSEVSPKDKRPFCNAFTGCGKKRSLYSGNLLDNRDDSAERIRIPAPIYRALLRAASQEIRESLEKESNADNEVSNLAIDYPAYLARRMQNRERYES